MNSALWIALAAGAVLPVQALINGRLAAGAGGPLPAATISFAVSVAALVVIQAALRLPVPETARLAALPPWAWIGGLFGMVYVSGAIYSVGALGTASAVCLILTGQIVASLAVDQFGLIGAPVHPITLLRLLGALLVAVGAVLVIRT